AQPRSSVIESRIEGFRRYAMLSGINDVMVLDCGAEPGDNSIELAHQKILSTVKSGLNFTGLFCITDPNALGALSAFRKLGIPVPEKVSVIGFDNEPQSEYYIPPLTTVCQNREKWGELVLQAITERRNSPNSKEPQKLMVTPRLIERASVATVTTNEMKEEVAMKGAS
ncbi:MAG: LacI family DNA-binding transcriptional regulator, partial [Planctomycetes bacterium]|nr:LacI family DNA-binding transcriptional regulator [Planctomycetota bacterium]